MKKILTGIVLGLAAGSAATWFFTRPSGPDADDAPKPAATAPEANPLHVPAPQRAAAGIVLAAPAPVDLAPELEAFGRVLDPSPYVAAAADVAAARAESEAAGKELGRARALYAQDRNVSGQVLEADEAAAEKARVQLDAARARLLAAWGPELAGAAGTLATAERLERGLALARIDFAPGEAPAAAPRTVRVSVLAGGGDEIDADVLGAAPAVDAQVQGAGYFVAVRRFLPAGTALRAVAPGPGPAVRALSVPRDAIVYHQGSAFAYILRPGDVFERRRVELGRRLGGAYAVTSGLADGDQVAVAGAQQLLSSELQAAAGPPD